MVRQHLFFFSFPQEGSQVSENDEEIRTNAAIGPPFDYTMSPILLDIVNFRSPEYPSRPKLGDENPVKGLVLDMESNGVRCGGGQQRDSSFWIECKTGKISKEEWRAGRSTERESGDSPRSCQATTTGSSWAVDRNQ